LNEQRRGYLEPEFLGAPQVEANFVFGWLGDWWWPLRESRSAFGDLRK
jgi:hypothetical protein